MSSADVFPSCHALNLSARQNKSDIFANSVYPDETARNRPSHQDLHSLPFCLVGVVAVVVLVVVVLNFRLKILFASMDMSKFKNEIVQKLKGKRVKGSHYANRIIVLCIKSRIGIQGEASRL